MRSQGTIWRIGAALTVSAAALVWAGTAAAQGIGHNLSGIWMPDFMVNEYGPSTTGRNTPWVPVSRGDPRTMKMPTAAELNKAITARMLVEHGKAPAPAAAPTPPAGGGAAAAAALAAVLNDAGKAAQARIKPGEAKCYMPNNVFSKIGAATMVIQGADKIAMTFDGYGPPRVIYLDNRTDENALPAWNGYSIGKWVGDTLRVKTTNIKGDTWQGNLPMSSAATLTEEFRITNNGKMLEVFATLEDPAYYKEPLRRMVYLDAKSADNELVDAFCLEGMDDQIDTLTGKAPH